MKDFPTEVVPMLQAEDMLLDEFQLTHILEQGFIVIEQACNKKLFEGLLQESIQLDHQFNEAKLTAGTLNHMIRRDATRWLQHEDTYGTQYLKTLENLATHLNQQLYSGIRRVEAHYAIYKRGDFYTLHRDNPAGQQSRLFSTVLYLNPDWQTHWQGELSLQDLQQQWHLILPMPNRLVIFQSDLMHEVRPALQERRSIAGWLRQDAYLS